MVDEHDDGYVRITLRMPRALHSALVPLAELQSHSMNAEIVQRLRGSTGSTVAIPTPLYHELSSVADESGRSLEALVVERLSATLDSTPVSIPSHLERRIAKSAKKNGRSFQAEVIRRLELSFNPAVAEPSAGVALQYMLAQQAYEAREAQVKAIRRGYEDAKQAGTATEQGRIDAWNAETELVYMRRAIDVLRQNFKSFYTIDPEVERDIQELEAEEQREAENAAAEDAAPKVKRKPKP